MVLVRKTNIRRHMYVDFTDLNAICPKDPYPLPDINLLIDGSSCYHTLSFMDAYFRYNQIQMDPLDAPKIAFILNHGNYYYNYISFNLKNASATNQWLMNVVCCPTDRAESKGLCRRHDSENYQNAQPCWRFIGCPAVSQEIWYALESCQLLFWGSGWKFPRVHSDPKKHWSQPG